MKSLACAALALLLVSALTLSAVAGDEEKEPSPEKTAVEVKAAKKEKPVEASMVMIETNHGNIKIELFTDKAPISVANFLAYVNDGFYNKTCFHRVVKDFVLQAGGFSAKLERKATKAPIKNEATNGLSNKRGTLSVARQTGKDTGTSHFFINLKDNNYLDHKGMDDRSYGYAVFAKVADDASMKVVDKIAKVPVATKSGMQNVPVDAVMISKAYVVGAAEEAEKKAQTEAKEATKEIKKEAKKVQPDTKEETKDD
jgi:cyclophilin family peptidyl-prolyl cis-trans isomerase